MKVRIPGALRSYTRESHVEAEGDTLHALFADLDRRYPGLRFRVVGKYVVFYRVTDDRVWIQRVLHSARDFGKLL